MSVSYDIVSSKLNKRDKFYFETVDFSFFEGDVSSPIRTGEFTFINSSDLL